MIEHVIETNNLTKKFGKQVGVNNLSIHVRKGKIYGLLGRNGAGKTTTMKMLLGLLTPTSGEVKIWGKDIKDHKKELLPKIGSLIETPGFYSNLTGVENLNIFADLRNMKDKSQVKDAMDFVGLPYNDKKLFSQYSLGMKQRLAIALAMMHNPELLILDEPTNGLDPIGISEMRKFIKDLCEKQGKTILISSHILPEIEKLADDIGIIDQGRLIEEGSQETFQIKRRKYVQLVVSNTGKTKHILEHEYNIDQYDIMSDNEIRIYEKELSVAKLNKTLVLNDIEVDRICVEEESLEDYFTNITGGAGIA
ncbi:MAG TPA: ABC transporter ATP-binding protein [Candidatus Merdenecus merdavium]|nr:ABC transporter ATP-binding protein [Candidatus Merdenecus merdavium]